MNLAKIYSTQFDVLNSFIVEIEVDVEGENVKNPSFKIVGLPDKAVEESKERVMRALKNTNFGFPQGQRNVISLSPAEEKKTGPIFDLAIAVGHILANSYVDFNPEEKIFFGELSLDGKLRKINGVLPMVKLAKEKGFKSIYLPEGNADEAALISGINIFPVRDLKQVIQHLEQENREEKNLSKIIKPYHSKLKTNRKKKNDIDFSDIKGQEITKRALEIAAAGGHNLMMYGPAGTGKTMMARAFTGILPDLSEDQALEVTAIHSAVGFLNSDNFYISEPPFRSPHHTSSYVSIIGGGTYPKPGEVTLAHRGVLFLDEFVEFDKKVLETLREPLEDNFVNISRAKGSVKFPSNFILIAAMNPPSEVLLSKNISYAEEQKFRKKLSGPIIDRIDLWTEVSKIEHKQLTDKSLSEETDKIKKRVFDARKIQKKRFNNEKLNAEMTSRDIEEKIKLSENVKEILISASDKMDFSPRVFHKMIKLARTIADLDGSENIEEKHILEALQYRPKDII